MQNKKRVNIGSYDRIVVESTSHRLTLRRHGEGKRVCMVVIVGLSVYRLSHQTMRNNHKCFDMHSLNKQAHVVLFPFFWIFQVNMK